MVVGSSSTLLFRTKNFCSELKTGDKNGCGGAYDAQCTQLQPSSSCSASLMLLERMKEMNSENDFEWRRSTAAEADSAEEEEAGCDIVKCIPATQMETITASAE